MPSVNQLAYDLVGVPAGEVNHHVPWTTKNG